MNICEITWDLTDHHSFDQMVANWDVLSFAPRCCMTRREAKFALHEHALDSYRKFYSELYKARLTYPLRMSC